MLVKDIKNQSEEPLKETEVTSEEVFHGVLLHVFRDTVKLPNGEHTVREYIKHWGAVCVVPLTDDGKVIMEKQYRYANNRAIIEIPAGKLDSPEEDRLEAAKRELQEETGFVADHWQDLGGLICAPAYASEYITMYLATGLHKGDRHLDDEEFLDVYEVPLQDLVDEIMKGTIEDAKTISAILKTWVLVSKDAQDNDR